MGLSLLFFLVFFVVGFVVGGVVAADIVGLEAPDDAVDDVLVLEDEDAERVLFLEDFLGFFGFFFSFSSSLSSSWSSSWHLMLMLCIAG